MCIYVGLLTWATIIYVLDHDKVVDCGYKMLLYSYITLMYYPFFIMIAILTISIILFMILFIMLLIYNITKQLRNCFKKIENVYNKTYVSKRKKLLDEMIKYVRILFASICGILAIILYFALFIYTEVKRNQLQNDKCKNVYKFRVVVNATLVICGICVLFPLVILLGMCCVNVLNSMCELCKIFMKWITINHEHKKSKILSQTLTPVLEYDCVRHKKNTDHEENSIEINNTGNTNNKKKNDIKAIVDANATPCV
jgi:hypothetical protein